MTAPNHKYASDLADKLKTLKDGLQSDEQKELLTGILTVAHGLVDGSSGNGDSKFKATIEQAFDPLPPEKINTILAYASDDNPNMIVKHEGL